MGLAPYAPEAHGRERAERALREVFDLDEGQPARFAGSRPASATRSCSGPRSDSASTGSRRRPAAARGHAPPLDAAHAPALRRHAPGAGGRRVHEREGEHAPRPGGLGRGSLRLPVLRRRVERGGRGLSRLSRRSAPGEAWRRRPLPFGPAYLGPSVDRRGRGGGDPRARPRGTLQGRLPRPDRGADRRAPGRRTAWSRAARDAWSSAPAPSATARSWPTRPTTAWCRSSTG